MRYSNFLLTKIALVLVLLALAIWIIASDGS